MEEDEPNASLARRQFLAEKRRSAAADAKAQRALVGMPGSFAGAEHRYTQQFTPRRNKAAKERAQQSQSLSGSGGRGARGRPPTAFERIMRAKG